MIISIVGGAGRVGLPLALVLAENNHSIKIIDTDLHKNKLINSRLMPFEEPETQQILSNLSEESLIASESLDLMRESEVCILIIGTPVLPGGVPSAATLLKLIKELTPYLLRVKILILRSTVFPGVSREISEFFASINLDIEVTFCPERLVEGKAISEIKSLPQIIGALNEKAFELASTVFKPFSTEIIRTTLEEAELIKLFANSYRYLNFAISNQFFEICIENNINWENVWNALQHNYPRAASLPRPGFAAGPCLVKDTQQLNYFYQNKFNLGKVALEVNEGLPDFIVGRLRQFNDLSEKTVGILGMTFKGEIDDFRDSLSFRLKSLLNREAKEVLCSDVKLQKDYFITTNNLIEKSDIIIIATPHSAYRKLVINKPLIDIWRITKNRSLL